MKGVIKQHSDFGSNPSEMLCLEFFIKFLVDIPCKRYLIVMSVVHMIDVNSNSVYLVNYFLWWW